MEDIKSRRDARRTEAAQVLIPLPPRLSTPIHAAMLGRFYCILLRVMLRCSHATNALRVAQQGPSGFCSNASEATSHRWEVTEVDTG